MKRGVFRDTETGPLTKNRRVFRDTETGPLTNLVETRNVKRGMSRDTETGPLTKNRRVSKYTETGRLTKICLKVEMRTEECLETQKDTLIKVWLKVAM